MPIQSIITLPCKVNFISNTCKYLFSGVNKLSEDESSISFTKMCTKAPPPKKKINKNKISIFEYMFRHFKPMM